MKKIKGFISFVIATILSLNMVALTAVSATEDIPAPNVVTIADQIGWKEIVIDQSCIELGDNQSWNYDQYELIGDDENGIFCLTGYVSKNFSRSSYYVSFYNFQDLKNQIGIPLAFYHADEIVNQIDKLGENETVLSIKTSSFSLDGTEAIGMAFYIRDTENDESDRYVMGVTTDGLSFTKMEIPELRGYDEFTGMEYAGNPIIRKFGSAYIVYSKGIGEFYTSEDLKNWTKHNFPEQFSTADIIEIFRITDKGVYFKCMRSKWYWEGYRTVTGIYFTEDFENYTAIIERPYSSDEEPKWSYVTSNSGMFNGNTFFVIEVELPSEDMTVMRIEPTGLNARLLFYNEATGDFTEVYSWNGNFGKGSYWYGWRDDAYCNIKCTENGRPTISYFDPEGNNLTRLELPYDIDKLVSVLSGIKDNVNYEIVFANNGKNMFVSYDYGYTYYEVNLPEDVSENGALLISGFGSQIIILSGDKFYICDKGEILKSSDCYAALENGNVTVIAKGINLFDKDVQLTVTEKGEDIPQDIISAFCGMNLFAYDISLERDGIKVQPEGNLAVYIKVPEKMNGENCKVFYVDEDNNITDMYALYDDGYMKFSTDHFSCYIIAEEISNLFGDTDCDGDVDAADLTKLARHVAKIELLAGDALLNADVDKDGDIDAADLTILARYVAKIIDEF